VNLDENLKGRCLELAREISRAYSAAPPPFDLNELFARYNVTNVRETILDRDAHLLLQPEGFSIEVNSTVSAARRRMSIAHELAHLVINEAAHSNSFDEHAGPVIEKFCNQIAGELLCPEVPIRRYFAKETQLGDWKRPIRCQTVIDAARDFAVSVDVMTRRVFFDLRLVPSSVALIWRFVDNTKTGERGAALRVTSAWHSMTEKAFIPLNKTAPSDSIILKAFQREGSFCRMEDVSLGTLKGRFEVEASGFMSFSFRSAAPPSRAVLSLLS
jgi:Zn-dependent peptidase ImmA (M78 family)